MVPAEFANFFLGSAGAAAALIGLLFVAISIAPENTVLEGASVERQGVASSTFTALVNAFFISVAALIPGANLGYTTLIMSLLGLSNSLNVGWNLLRGRQKWQQFIRRIILIVIGVVLYGFELYYALQLLLSPTQTTNVFNLSTILLGIYGVGLLRAWELLGARRFSLTNWLNPLAQANQSLSVAQKDEDNAKSDNQYVDAHPEPSHDHSNQRPTDERQQVQQRDEQG